MKLPLAYYGDPILRKKAAPVEKITPEILQLVDDMIETMEEQKGIGLAAPQVHRSVRIFITKVPREKEDEEWDEGILRVFINPEIVHVSSDTTSYDEGCLSIPKLRGEVCRPFHTTVRALDRDGNSFEITLSGLESVCVLHENDHINGVLFIDRMDPKARRAIEPELKKIKKEYYKKPH